MPTTEPANLRCIGRLSGDDLVKWLGERPELHRWWLCYDADDGVVRTHASSCLAFHLGVDADASSKAMADSGVFARGKSDATRLKLLGVPAITERHSVGGCRHSFLWLGTAVSEWSVRQQLAGQAPRAPPSVVPWQQQTTTRSAAASQAAAAATVRKPPPAPADYGSDAAAMAVASGTPSSRSRTSASAAASRARMSIS